MKSSKEEAFFYTVMFCLTVLAGCDVFSDRVPLQVKIPPHPTAWNDLTGRGTLRDSRGLVGPRECRPGEVITLTWMKEEPVLLLYCPGDGRGSLKPAGLVRGPQAHTQPVLLTWEEGWLAESILFTLGNKPTIPALNWERIRDLYLRVTRGYSPWFLDRDHFLDSWSKGTWRAGIFRETARTAEIPVPEGVWIPDDPFLPALPGGRVEILRIRDGINLWFSGNFVLTVTALPGNAYDWGVFSTLREPSEPAM